MASNPQFPEDRGPQHDGRMTVVKEGTRGGGWVPVAIMVVAAALLAAIITLAPRAPKITGAAPSAADVPAQPTRGQLQVSDIRVSRVAGTGPARITGTLFNGGNTFINAVQAVAIFRGNDGSNLQAVTAPLIGVQQDGSTQPFVDNPIKPGERRAFQMELYEVPQGWNGGLPQLQFPVVTSQAQDKS